MIDQAVVRKDKRTTKSKKQFRKMKRGAATVGTVMVGCAAAAPILQPTTVTHADTIAQTKKSVDTRSFINEIATHAQPVAQANDLYASVMIAQAIVESGWGGSTLSQSPYHNLFGVKGSSQTTSTYMDTLEYLNGKWVNKKEPFRQYNSFSESFSDNASVIRNVSFGSTPYYSGAWKSNTSSYQDATKTLTGKYATDPGYAQKLNNLISTYDLTKYDTPTIGNESAGTATMETATAQPVVSNTASTTSTAAPEPTTLENENLTGSQGTYLVKSGDSVWGIADSAGMTVDQLVQMNNIKNNFVYPGQTLSISGTHSSGTSTGANSTSTSTTPTAISTPDSSSSTSGDGTYTVKAGESVWGIADAHGMTMNELVQLNNIKNNFVYPGKQLIVTNKKRTSASTSESTAVAQASETAGSGTYTVQPGESVWSVAHKHGLTNDQLIQLNNIKNNFVYPGQRLVVTGGTSAAASPSATSSTANTGNGTYTVKAGESVWAVAHKNGLTNDQLIQMNNIKNNFVYPGQTLNVAK